jgi:capsular polysaccharide export protein
MKILFCCHYANIQSYFADLSRHINGHETDVVDLSHIEKNKQPVKYRGRVPWRELWNIARVAERGHCVKHRFFYVRGYRKYLPLSALRKSLHLFRAYAAALDERAPDAVVVWGGKYRASLLALAARIKGIKITYLENGALPNTTAIDLQGINARNSLPRDPEFYRSLQAAPAEDKAVSLVARAVKPNKPGEDAGLETLPERYIFAPFQVDFDTQILLQSPWIRNMRQFYSLLVDVFRQMDDPQLHLVFKEHPSSPACYPDLHRKVVREERVHFVNNHSTQALIENAESIVTINSSVGIESLLFDKPVIVLGCAFYNIHELAMHAGTRNELLQAMRSARNFTTDQQLRRNFIHYLQSDYLLPGKKFSTDEMHLQAVAHRIVQLLDRQSA